MRAAALGGLLAVGCLLAAAYSAIVPPFEAPDEPGHYAYVNWLLDGHGIPVQGDEPPPLQPEFSQPPLYYLIEAPFAWLAGREPTNLPDWETQHNPFQDRTAFGNVNLYLHSPREAFPWTGAVLGLHLMRLVNLIFGVALVLATYGCAREMRVSRPLAWSAAALVGFMPQVSFIGGALNADNAVGSLGALSLYLLLWWLNRGPSPVTAALLGLAIGGAALAKLSGLVAAGMVLLFMALRGSKRAVSDAFIAAAVGAIVAGWWYVRNWAALGDPLGWNSMLVAIGQMLRDPPLDFPSAAALLLSRWYTGLAAFGWANLPVHWAWYWLALVLAGWGVVGLLLAARRAVTSGRLNLAHWLLVVWPLAFLISLSRWVQVNTAADQWRLLLPAYPALAVLLVLGWRELVAGWWPAIAAIPAGLLILNVGAPTLVVIPAYAEPRPYSGSIEHPMDVRFGDALELVGYSAPVPLDVKPGGTVTVDLFWRSGAVVPKNYAADMGAVDAQARLDWKELSTPDEGRAPMTGWRAGEIVRDRHRIAATQEMLGTQTLLLSVIDPVPPGNHLPARSGDGQRLANDAVTLGRFLVLPARTQPAAVKDDVAFDDHLQLTGHTIQQDRELLRVTLNWKASAPASTDYTVFTHLVGSDDTQVAQSDGQPGNGAFPTSLLAAGAEVPDVHVLDVTQAPSGEYRLEVGLYELSTGKRLATARGESSVSLPVRLS